jgi:Chain length determinant protein.
MENKPIAPKKDEIDLVGAYRIFIRRKWWFAVSAIIILILGIIYTFIQPVNCIVKYQINIEKDYSNSNLTKLYPDSMPSLNYFNADNASAIFKSAQIFESLKNLPEKVNYSNLLNSGYVTIERDDVKANIFTIKVPNPDRALANKIAMTLINTFDDYISNKNKEALDKIVASINSDIGGIESKDQGLEQEISKLKNDIDSLYSQLYDYIVNYNIDLASKLKTESQGSYSSYNIVIPPNKFEDEISFINNKINIYNGIIVDSKSEEVNLSTLRDNLTKDESIITERVSLLSKTPIYETDDRRVRNIIISMVLSVIVGIIVVFTADFFLSIKKKKG